MPKSVQLKDKDGKVYPKTKNDIMTASLSTNITGVNVNNYIPKFTQNISTTRNLTLNNGKIIIGKGISKVKVSANTFIDINGTGYLWLFIRKNTGNVASCIEQHTYPSNFTSCSIPEKLIDVTVGDTVDLKYDVTFPYPYNIRGDVNTWLTVEVVE